MSNAPIIACQNLYKCYGKDYRQQQVLANLNFELDAGKSIAIIGASGCGKTTLLQVLGGLDTIDKGSVEIAGRNLATLSDSDITKWRNQHLSFIFQFHLLLPEFSALENVALPMLIKRQTVKQSYAHAKDYLEQVGLSAHAKKTPNQLSGGERQRVSIARALITQPRCILADEPTGNLDDDNAKRVFDLLLSACKKNKTGLVVVSHNQQLAAKTNHQLYLREGRLHADTL